MLPVFFPDAYYGTVSVLICNFCMHFKDMVAFYSAIGSSLLSRIQVLILGSVYGKVLIIAHYTIFSTKDIKSKENVTPSPNSAGISQQQRVTKTYTQISLGERRWMHFFFWSDANLGLHWLSCPSHRQETSVYVWELLCAWAYVSGICKLKEAPPAALMIHREDNMKELQRANDIVGLQMGEESSPFCQQLTRR